MNSLDTIGDNATCLFHSNSLILYLSDPISHLMGEYRIAAQKQEFPWVRGKW
jgi:hypothetical protein